MPWAKEVISILQKFYDITVVSHGYSPNLKLKEEWIRKNLPGVKFIGVNLKNHKDKSCLYNWTDVYNTFIGGGNTRR